MRTYPFLVRADGTGESLKAVEGGSGAYNESWLQKLLQKNPEILPVAEIEPVFSPLIPIGLEIATGVGTIDNLFISPSGYLVLVETKLWRNPEAKREVVAQAIDYGSSISKWSYSQLNDAVRDYTKRFENEEMDLADWIESKVGYLEGGRDFFEETVAKNLRLGRFLIAIVGDRIRPSVVEMVSYINRYPHLAANVALIELNIYRWKSGAAWPLLVVPTIVAQTEIVERSVIQVTVTSEGAPKIEVRQEGETQAGGKRRVPLTEEAFWELLGKEAPEAYEKARTLIERYRAQEGITIDPATTGLVARLSLQETGQQASLFFINTKGQIGVSLSVAREQVQRAGLDLSLADEYVDKRMRKILKAPPARKDLSHPLSDVNLDDLMAAVDDFIECVQHAEPVV